MTRRGEIWKSRGRRRRVLLRSSIKLYALWWLAYLERSVREIAWIYELKYSIFLNRKRLIDTRRSCRKGIIERYDASSADSEPKLSFSEFGFASRIFFLRQLSQYQKIVLCTAYFFVYLIDSIHHASCFAGCLDADFAGIRPHIANPGSRRRQVVDRKAHRAGQNFDGSARKCEYIPTRYITFPETALLHRLRHQSTSCK